MGSVGELLGQLRSAAQAVYDAEIESLVPSEVRDHLRSVSSTISLLELVRVRDMRALEEASAHDLTGAADMVGFLSTECGLTPEAINERVSLARQLHELPATVARLASGQISFDTATVVANSTAKMRTEDRPAVEAGILEAAAVVPPGRLRSKAEEIVATVDSGPLQRDANRARERRALRIGPDRDGLATISGYLTSVCAAHLRARLEPLAKPADRKDKRTAVQRRHDALQELCISGTGMGRPVLVVAGVEAMMGKDGPPPLLQGLVPISHGELSVLLENADISVALKDLKGNLAYVGRKSRRFSTPKRRGIVAVSPTCAFQGCTRQAVDVTAHHIVEFGVGGETTIETEAPLCPAHQERVHRDGWWVGTDGAGGFRTLPPGHPESPKARMTPEEYLRKQREARFGRERKRKDRRPAAAGAQPAAP